MYSPVDVQNLHVKTMSFLTVSSKPYLETHPHKVFSRHHQLDTVYVLSDGKGVNRV